MTIESAVATYGYVALFAGGLLEGETVVIAAGFLAFRGYLDLSLVVVTAFVAAYVADQTFFLLGQRQGRRFLARHPAWLNRVDRVSAIIRRHPLAIIFGYRFMYGVRTVTPFAIGMSGIRYRSFALITLASTALWATVVSTAGYYFGNVLQPLLGDLERYDKVIVLALLVLGLVSWVVLKGRGAWKQRRKSLD